MELGPIVKALFRSKTRFLLISLEVALTLAIVVNCVNMVQDVRHRMARDTGLDEAGLFVVTSQPFAEEFKEDGYFKNSREADLRLLRELAGVRNAEAFSAIPLSGSGSSTGRKPLGSEMDTVGVGYFQVGIHAVDTLGVRLVEGRDFTESDVNNADAKNVIITKAYAERLFPEGDALGKQLQGREPDEPATVVGIIEQMHCSWPRWDNVNFVLLRPAEVGNFAWGLRYMVRAEPSRLPELMALAEERLIELNGGRNVTVEKFEDIKSRTYEAEVAVMKMLTAVIVLLVFVTALGIIGMTSFSVTERVHHIGTRRALGARKLDILRYFLTENCFITTTGVVTGAGLAYLLNYALIQLVNGVQLEWVLVVVGVIGMWLVGQLATVVPAWRGAQISPAVATRSV
jgi:putative ABC transport system permease protein